MDIKMNGAEMAQVGYKELNVWHNQRGQTEAMLLLKLVLLALAIRRVIPVCRLLGRAQPPELIQAGDFILGGIFTFHTGYRGRIPSFQTLPKPPTCLL